MTIEPFKVAIPDAVLDDLWRRLDATRWPDEVEDAGWDYGTSLGYMRSLAGYWRNDYDWRRREADLNRLPQFRATIDGQRIHFVNQRGKGPKPLPLVISHGWPGSFVEMRRILPLLTDPAAHGGDAADAFDVVVPSLPGVGFSDPARERGMTPQRIANLWARLMAELGYARYGAQGGDWGSAISIELGLAEAKRVAGIHLNFIAGRFLFGGTINQTPEDPVARDYIARLRAWWDSEGGYNHQQGTKPQTLGFGLTDSPVGLAAWILEKFRTWSDGSGDFERLFGRDDLLDNVMLYWVGSPTGAMRIYLESRMRPLNLSPSDRAMPPVGVAAFPKEIPLPPRALAERSLNIARWTDMPRGGHFAAMEQPDLLAEDIRAFFRPLR